MAENPPPPPADPPAPPADPPAPPKKKEKKEEDDDDIFKEILEEYKSQVSEDVYATIKNLSIPKQLKILKSMVKALTPAPAGDEKKDKKKVIKVKPANIDDPAPPTLEEEDDIIPLGAKFKNKEEWLTHFMNTDKVYFKGKFNKTG